MYDPYGYDSYGYDDYYGYDDFSSYDYYGSDMGYGMPAPRQMAFGRGGRGMAGGGVSVICIIIIINQALI